MKTKGALGLLLIFGGLVVGVGSISGNLGPMIAAQFDPQDLNVSSGGGSGKSSSSSLPGWLQTGLSWLPFGIGK